MPDAPDDADFPLANVVDDLTPRDEAIEWAVTEVAAKRPFDDVAADLTAAGWSEADAADIVELARRHTRAHRGVLTRADVVDDVNRRYRRAMTPGWFLGLPTVVAAMRLLYSIATVATLRRRRTDSSPPKPSNDNR